LRAVELLVALALCGGCVAVVPQQPEDAAAAPMAQVRLGMSAGQVRDVLGEPTVIEKQGEQGLTEYWYYQSGGVLILRDGEVQFKGQARAGTG